jgi:proteasome lid subunit RPN8/RPN11
MSEVRAEESLDVRNLARQKLPDEAFPGGRSAEFRAFISPQVHAELWKHGIENTKVEICGVLVGNWLRDAAGPYVTVLESIRGEGAETRFAEVTFTHQTWAKINAEMDSRYAHLKIVGWYHTHPDFGIFLSDRDRFIQEHFFSGPGQVALVIDPVRKQEGLFVWRGGKSALLDHYWVGDRLMAGDPGTGELAAAAGAGRERGASPPAASAGAPESGQPAGSLVSGSTQLLLYLVPFLLGYLLASYFASYRSAWEQRTLIEGAVAHFGLLSVVRPGLSEELDRLGRDLEAAARPLEAIKPEGEEQQKAAVEARSQIRKLATRVANLKTTYGYSAAEEAAVRQAYIEKLAELRQLLQPRAGADAATGPPLLPPSGTEPAKAKPEADGKGPAANEPVKTPERTP